MKQHYDVIILGLGGIGSAALCHLAKRGLSVLGIEQFEPVHAHGSSHGSSRMIRQAYMEHPGYVPLVKRSYENWIDLENELDTKLLHITGGLMMGREDSYPVTGSIQSAQEHHLVHEVLTAAEVRERYPAMKPPDDFIALYEKMAGYLVPEDCVRSHLKSAEMAGAETRFNTVVRSWQAHENSVSIVTDEGTAEAEHIVIAAGPWLSKAYPRPLPLTVQRMVMFWFEPRDRSLFDASICPVYIWEADDGELFYGFPVQEGEKGVKIAIHSIRTPCTPETINRQVSDEEIQQMRDYLKPYIPAMDGECTNTRTCMYTSTPDNHFIIGKCPENDRVVLLGGFSGHGFKFAAVVGEIAAELVCDGRTDKQIEMFSPGRF